MAGVTIWENKADGNNHLLSWSNCQLTLTVIKPDGTEFTDTKPTRSTAEQWRRAFAANSGQWCESNKAQQGRHFWALRTNRVNETGEAAVWKVDHDKPDEQGKYVLADGFAIM